MSKQHVFVALTCVWLSGCASMLNNSIEKMTSEENQARYAEVIGDDAIQKSVHDLMATTSGGLVDGLTEEERQKRVQEATAKLVDTLSDRLEANLKEKLGPALRQQITGILSASLQTILNPHTRKEASTMASEVVAATTKAFSVGIKDELGPAMEQVIKTNLTPALVAALKEQREPIGDLVKTITASAMEGVGESLKDDGALGSVLNKRENQFRENLADLRRVVVGLASLLGILILVCVLIVRRAHRLSVERDTLSAERDAGEDALLRLATAVKDISHTEAGNYIAARMKEKNNSRSGSVFKKLLEKNPSLHFEPSAPSAELRQKIP